jgi:hypothetical protein
VLLINKKDKRISKAVGERDSVLPLINDYHGNILLQGIGE